MMKTVMAAILGVGVEHDHGVPPKDKLLPVYVEYPVKVLLNPDLSYPVVAMIPEMSNDDLSAPSNHNAQPGRSSGEKGLRNGGNV